MAERAMSELREIARLQYERASPELKGLAVEFFKSMDADGDGQVDLLEFWSFMSEQEGLPPHFNNPLLFTLLDADGSRGLGFDEFKTLFYMICQTPKPNPSTSRTSSRSILSKREVAYKALQLGCAVVGVDIDCPIM